MCFSLQEPRKYWPLAVIEDFRECSRTFQIIYADQLIEVDISFMLSLLRTAKLMRRVLCVHSLASLKYSFSAAPSHSNGVPPSSHPTPDQSQGISPSESTPPASNQATNGPPKRIFSAVAQKAIWASFYIQTILNSSPPTNVQESLRDLILRPQTKPEKSDQFNLQQEHRQQILKYFSDGVTMDNSIYSQQRVTEAQDKHFNITFFPTNSVSKLVFNVINERKSKILVGSYGIGKTFSIILFAELASHVNRLKYLAYGKWIPQQQRKRFKEELDQLLKLKLIGNYPKLWYWSVKRDLNQREKHIKRLIIGQTNEFHFPDAVKKELQQCETLGDLIDKLIDLHPKQMEVFRTIVIDQINTVASPMREWNQEVDRLKKENKSKQNADQDIVKNCKIPSQQILPLIKQYKRLGFKFILNSSLQVERELLIKNSNVHKLTLQIYDHGLPRYQEIQYAEQLKSTQTQLQFAQFFLFLLEQQFKYTPNNTDKFRVIKQRFTLQMLTIKTYYRMLFIREFLESTKLNQLQQLTGQEISTRFDTFCLTQSSKRLQEFVDKGNEHIKAFKRFIIQLFGTKASQCYRKNQQNWPVSILWLQDIIKKKGFVGYNVKKYLVSNEHNKQLLPCRFVEDNKQVKFDWSPKDFLQIAVPVLYPEKIELRMGKVQEPLRTILLNKVNSVIGAFTEIYIMLLCFESSSIQVKYKGPNAISTQIDYKIHGVLEFLHFNAKAENKLQPTLHDNLQTILKKCSNNPDKQYLGTPITKAQQNPSINSQAVDFMFVKYISHEQIFEITTLDVAIGKNIIGKAEKAVIMLKKLLKKVEKYNKIKELKPEVKPTQQQNSNKPVEFVDLEDKNKYRITHVMICPSKYCLKQEIIVENLLKVRYYPIQEIQFIDCLNTPLTERFEQWKSLTLY